MTVNFFLYISNRKPQQMTHPSSSVRVCWRRRMSPPSTDRWFISTGSRSSNFSQVSATGIWPRPSLHRSAAIHPSIHPLLPPSQPCGCLFLHCQGQIKLNPTFQFSLLAASAYVRGLVYASVCICTYTCNEIKKKNSTDCMMALYQDCLEMLEPFLSVCALSLKWIYLPTFVC